MSVHLLDANALIALTMAEHEHHEAATQWLTTVGSFAVCPIVEGALLRFLVRLGESSETAAAVLRAIRASVRCDFWSDSLSYLDVNLSTIRGHRQITDSYLAELARAHGARVATFDRGLVAQHPESCVLIPT